LPTNNHEVVVTGVFHVVDRPNPSIVQIDERQVCILATIAAFVRLGEIGVDAEAVMHPCIGGRV
jgi:hypothetical protein